MINALIKLKEVLLKGVPKEVVKSAIDDNSWFTEETINCAVKAICERMLDRVKLEKWSSKYIFTEKYNVGVITAGNIPLVGFYDILAILISKSVCYYKLSSKDCVLMQWVIDEIKNLDYDFNIYELKDDTYLDAIIATGSDNTNRYFQSIYGDLKALYRGSRTSVAIIAKDITDAELAGLHSDIFMHWGLGCRNVSHLYVENGFDLKRMVDFFNTKKVTFKKYINNYRYACAEKVLNNEFFIDGGYYILQNKNAKIGGLTEITYSFYDSLDDLRTILNSDDSKIQCVVSSDVEFHERGVLFGKAQFPELEDAPDSKDVLIFILNIAN